MDRVQAKWVLLRKLVEYRRYSYDKLRTMVGDSQYIEIIGRSGTEYQIEIDFVWDDQPDCDVRILASIDDGGWRAFCPLGSSDLVSPPDRG